MYGAEVKRMCRDAVQCDQREAHGEPQLSFTMSLVQGKGGKAGLAGLVGERGRGGRCTVPMMPLSGVRSSWETMDRNSSLTRILS